tara:strand:+ start:30 stop:332 length:303 start_codon:yes stop_codon:yes gene_type:complete
LKIKSHKAKHPQQAVDSLGAVEMSKVINIDGKEYPIDNLKNDQKVLIDQITLCQNKINEISALVRQIDIYQIAKNDYVQKLSTSLQTDETLKNIEDSEVG